MKTYHWVRDSTMPVTKPRISIELGSIDDEYWVGSMEINLQRHPSVPRIVTHRDLEAPLSGGWWCFEKRDGISY